jgi:hypothetical protein
LKDQSVRGNGEAFGNEAREPLLAAETITSITDSMTVHPAIVANS